MEQVEKIILRQINLNAIAHTIKNWWGNPCISHVMKYTVGWESHGRKSTHIMGNLWVPISQVLPIRWVLLHLPYHGKLMWKPMHFPHSDIGSFFLWLRVNMYYFHTCIYINPILLWQSLSSWCVVDHLWKLTLRSLLCFLSTLFSCAMCNRTSVWVATKPLWW